VFYKQQEKEKAIRLKNMATFEEFLTKKRIDIALFAQNKPQEWQEYAHLYEKMGEKSFDHQKKFFFNSLRAMFPLTTPIVEVEKKKATSSEGLPKKMPLKKAVVPTTENIEMPEKTPEEAVIAETPPPAPKKIPMKKPVVKATEEEKLTEEKEVLAEEKPQTPPPAVKKMPLKAKPIIKAVEEEKVTEEKDVLAEEKPQTPPPAVKKMPLKAKPIIKAVEEEKVTEEKDVLAEEKPQTPPPAVKKMPLKAKPIMKPAEEEKKKEEDI
jgi:hypothetical protein